MSMRERILNALWNVCQIVFIAMIGLAAIGLVTGCASTGAHARPGFIVFVKQCEHPLVIYGVDTASYFYTLDATELTQDKLEAIAATVDTAHRTIETVPCIGNPKNVKAEQF